MQCFRLVDYQQFWSIGQMSLYFVDNNMYLSKAVIIYFNYNKYARNAKNKTTNKTNFCE